MSRYIHVPDDNSSIPAAGDELSSVWGVAQTLNLFIVSLQFDGSAFASSDVPHDDGVVWAAGEQHPLDRVPTQRRHIASVSLERGDQAAAVLLKLQDGHLTRLVPYEGVSGLHIKPGIRLRLRKKKLRSPEKLLIH